MKRNLPLLVILALAIGAGAWWLSQGTSPAPQSTAIASVDVQSSAADVPEGTIVEMSLGSDTAPVTIIEYASFTCPHCQTFHQGDFKALKADYIDTGKVRFVFREVYFDRPGLWASIVARCAGEERFFAVTNLLFEEQRSWARAGDPAAIAAALRKLGARAGMSPSDLDACLSDAAQAEAMVGWYRQNADEHNIASTPSFVINGTTYQNMSYQDMRDIIEAQS